MNDALLTERREHVIDRLSTDFARGTFEVDELERRLALAHAADSPAELEGLVTDLVPVTAALVPAKHMRVVMGSVERVGPWAVPQRLSARVVFGNLVLDLRDAHLAPGVTTIDVSITMGNIEVIVPPGVTVDVDATSTLGHIEERIEPTAYGATACIRVVGRVKLGNLELSTMRAGETYRAARRRRRRRGRHNRLLTASER